MQSLYTTSGSEPRIKSELKDSENPTLLPFLDFDKFTSASGDIAFFFLSKQILKICSSDKLALLVLLQLINIKLLETKKDIIT